MSRLRAFSAIGLIVVGTGLLQAFSHFFSLIDLVPRKPFVRSIFPGFQLPAIYCIFRNFLSSSYQYCVSNFLALFQHFLY